MHSLKHASETRDLSTELLDAREWQVKDLRHLDILLDASVFAYDVTSGLLAIGTDSGIIRLLGGPAVDVKVDNGSAVKLLQFVPSVFKLVCVDALGRLRVWDLDNLDAKNLPRLAATTSVKDSISAIYTSPSYSHVLVMLLSGDVRVFDMVVASWAPHPIPNMWGVHEDRMLSSGAITERRPNSRQGMMIVHHPRDLGLLFVAYEGGVALYDLEKRTLKSVYELVLPPGAPGGAGYNQPNLMTTRCPPVTSVAVHPSGHLFAVGHLNGEITFWATDDEDKPIACITLDEDDVNMVNGEKLAAAHHAPSMDREPIFKLVWSGYSNSDDPRGGTTTLTVLGGRNDGACGVTVFHLPAFNPLQSPTNAPPHDGIHTVFRDAMRASVTPSDTYSYTTPTPVVDLMVLPKESPHFGGTYDPEAIMFLTEGKGGTRSLEARVFPPPQFKPVSDVIAPIPGPTDHDAQDIDIDLAATLAAMQVIDDPTDIELPQALWSGKNAPEQMKLVKLERDAHTKLTNGRQDSSSLPLFGGQAWAEETHDTRLIKFAPHRIIVSHHRDMTVKFQDLNAQLLTSSPEEPLLSSFPRLASELTIDILELLADSAVSEHFPPVLLQNVDIQSVQLSPYTLEVAVALTTGEIIIYHLDGVAGRYWESADSEFVCLEHIVGTSVQRFHPTLMLRAQRGSVVSYSLSDIGMLAVAYDDGSVLIYDTGHHTVVMRDTADNHQKKSLFHRSDTANQILNLSWTVCGIKKDPQPQVRLLAVTSTGDARVYTVDRRDRSSPWAANFTADTDAIPSALANLDTSIVIEAKTGFRCRADNHGLMTAMDPDGLIGGKRGDKHWLWITAGAKGARTTLDVTGDRIAKVAWPSKGGNVVEIQMVEHMDASTLVVFTDLCQAFVYSLPGLEMMHTLDLPFSGKSIPLISADTTGDYIVSALHPNVPIIDNVTYGSLFSQRRSYYKLPLIDLAAKRRPFPPAPTPVGMGPASLMNTLAGLVSGPRVLSGEDIDALLAGRERAPPKQAEGQQQVTRSQVGPGQAAGYNMPDVSAVGQQLGQGASQVGQQIGQGATAIFGRVQNALSERGEMLDTLQDSMRNLQEGSKNALQQARLTAAKQGAKGWFTSLM